MTESREFDGKNIFVLTPGLPGWGLMDYSYWDTLTFDSQWTRELNVKFILVEPGPMSSYHDRACEIFAQLNGSLTDFGEEHSKLYRHNRYGRNFSTKTNLRNYWSEKNPVNFICHCIGINTVRYLQYLLAKDFWAVGTSDKWIKSIISINGNINGTQFIHFLGIDAMDGTCPKTKLLKSTKKIHNGVVWAISKLKDLTEQQKQAATEWHLDHWNISTNYRNWLNESFNESNLFTNLDNLFYDSSIHGAKHLNSIVPYSYSCTYYFSFYGLSTKSISLYISHQLNPVLFAPSSYILHTKFSSGLLSSDNLKNCDWYDNDGVYPVASQIFPLNCQKVTQFDSFSTSLNITQGFWYYSNLQNIIGCKCIIDHFSLIWCRKFLKCEAFQLSDQEQKEFYNNLLIFMISLK